MRLTLAAFSLLALTAAAPAQQQGSATGAFTGFSIKSDEPVNVEADNLEVQDKDQKAIFTGNVIMKQGDSTLRAKKLTIFYFDKDKAGPNNPNPQPKPAEAAKKDGAGGDGGGGKDIKRLEAEGDVVVTSSNNQRATGARGVFDTQANTADLYGGVVVSQQDNVVRGDKLHVDLTSQISHLESGGTGRVQGVFKPRQTNDSGTATKR